MGIVNAFVSDVLERWAGGRACDVVLGCENAVCAAVAAVKQQLPELATHALGAGTAAVDHSRFPTLHPLRLSVEVLFLICPHGHVVSATL